MQRSSFTYTSRVQASAGTSNLYTEVLSEKKVFRLVDLRETTGLCFKYSHEETLSKPWWYCIPPFPSQPFTLTGELYCELFYPALVGYLEGILKCRRV